MNSLVRVILVIATMLALVTTASGCVRIKTNLSEDELSVFIPNNALRGNGKLETKTIALPEFTKVRAHRSADVTLVAGDVKQISVTADENVMPYVVITCQAGVLDITIDDAVKSVGDITFEVALPMNDKIKDLKVSSAAEISMAEGLTLTVAHPLELSASSSGEIKGSFEAKELSARASSAAEIGGRFRATKVEIEASSSADMEVSLMAEQLAVQASSAASVELEGTVRNAHLQASSAGDIDSEELTTTQCWAEASSGADIHCFCTGDLKASASSGATIRCKGNPATTDIQKSSGGSVTIAK